MRAAQALLLSVTLAAVCGCAPGPRPAPPLPSDELVARAVHTTTTLADGTAVVVGGCVTDGCGEATASVFDVAVDGTAAPGPALHDARDGHVALLLADGSLLVAGGFSAEGRPPLASAELRRPGSGWTRVGGMAVARGGHAAAVLGSGDAVVGGGWVGSATYTSSTEVFDRARGVFAPGPDLPVAVDGLSATALRDGRVLFTGGQIRPGVATSQAAVLSADGRSMTVVGPLLSARFKHGSVLLRDGRVLVIGGTSDDREVLRSTEVFDPVTATFRPGPTLAQPRYKLAGAALVLPDGRVLVGGSGAGLEVIDPTAMTARALHRSEPGPGSFSSLNSLGGRVLILGGYDDRIALTRSWRLIAANPT